jgi:ethanolamine utilization protein EutA
VGEIIRTELGWSGSLICLDCIDVADLDFVDVGPRLEPSGTFPVVVKSLVFPSAHGRPDLSAGVERG